MFRIVNSTELSKRELVLARARNESFAAKLARSLAALGADRKPGGYPYPKLPPLRAQPVTTVNKLYKARRAGTSRAHAFTVVNPDNMMRFT